MSLSTQVLLSLLLGISCGIFFGESVGFLKIVGQAFIMLLQMTVLPYAVASLISGLGRLSPHQAKALGIKGGLLLLVFWTVALIAVVLTPLTFPEWTSSSFFSAALVETAKQTNFLDLYIPANPFKSLADAALPAVVFFSISLGLALIGVKGKDRIIEPLVAISDALMRVTMYVAKLLPLGVFAIAASSAGTIQVEDFGRLQVYLLPFIALSLVMTLVVVPALVTAFTPLRWGEFLWFTKDALITAFATGNLLVVMPILIQKSKELVTRSELDSSQAETTVDVLIPASFNFPNMGHLLTLSFVLFAGWFSGFSVSLAKYPAFLIAGLFSMFGKPQAAIPFMLDFMRVPADMFQLYLLTALLSGRFGTLLSAVSTLALAILGAYATSGRFSFRLGALFRFVIISLVITVVTVGALRMLFHQTVQNVYTKDKILMGMHLLRDALPATVHKSVPSDTANLRETQSSAIEQILKRGRLKVGYLPDQLPFSFFNASGQLVGFDIEMAHLLARDLKVELEFVPVDRDSFPEKLEEGYCDLVMSAIAVTPERARKVSFSNAYLNLTVALVVKGYRREEFSSRDEIKKIKSLRIGAANVPYYLEKVSRYLPQARLIPLSSPEDFFEGKVHELDALLISAEAGSAWCLIYPEYKVAVPQPDILTGPVAYPVARGDRDTIDFLNTWIELKKQDKTISRAYDHWILGKSAGQQQPRWSIIRDVLHLVD